MTIGIVCVVSLVVDDQDRTRAERHGSLTSYRLSIYTEDGDIVSVGIGVVSQDIATDGGIVPGCSRDVVGDRGLIGDGPTNLLQHACPEFFIGLINHIAIILLHLMMLLLLIASLLAHQLHRLRSQSPSPPVRAFVFVLFAIDLCCCCLLGCHLLCFGRYRRYATTGQGQKPQRQGNQSMVAL